MAITTKDIARICNVSRGTVDRALNNRGGISEKTRERIQKVAKQHNYTPHLIGAALSKGRTMSIGVLVFDLQNRYFAQVCNSINRVAREHGFSTLIAVSEKDIELEAQAIKSFAARGVDGMILLPITRGDAFVETLNGLNIPIVTIGNPLAPFHHVSIDESLAAYQSTRYIHERGYGKIYFISPPLRKRGRYEGRFNIATQELRAEGFLKYADETPSLKHALITSKEYMDEAAEIVRTSEGKSAFFCSSDVYALELMCHFKRVGIRIPEDAGLMGFDNLDILKYIQPRITTVSTSVEAQGKRAMDTLAHLISGQSVPLTQYLEYQICDGETI